MSNELQKPAPASPPTTEGDKLHPAYDDKVRKAIDNQSEVRPTDYPDRKLSGPA